MALIEIGDCVFDRKQFGLSHGFETLDPGAQEAFVNHLHIAGEDAAAEANRVIELWINEMRSRWPNRSFRIYRQIEPLEITIRFHLVRPGLPNWCEQEIEIIMVSPMDHTVEPLLGDGNGER
jgi:hypothetical protein